MKCTPYETVYYPWEQKTPCHCPRCGGFLKWKEDGQAICNKCKADLIVLPDVDEDTGEELEYGKICDISVKKWEK